MMKSGVNVRLLLDLPSDIVLDILLRLPITTILRCRCVCKTLNRLLSLPSSAHLYLQSHPRNITNLFLNRLGCEFHFMEYDSTLPSNTPTRINTEFNDTPRLTVLLVGFCNGFLCLLDRFSLDRLYITNPILGEFVIVPKHRAFREISKGVREVFGFGFSRAESLYKVMALSPIGGSNESIGKSSEVRVLTLRGGSQVVNEESWRIVGNDAPFADYHKKLEENANVNGAVHWIHLVDGICSESEPVDDFIYSFNFDKECVKSIPNPPVSGGYMYQLMSLGALGNRLCMFLFDRTTKGYVYVDIWSMKEYGVKESWTKVRIRVSSFPFGLEGKYPLRPVVLSTDWEEGGEILMTCMRILVCWDPKTGALTRLRLAASAVDHCFLASIFTPSFLSLKQVDMGGLRIHNVHPRGTPSTNKWPWH